MADRPTFQTRELPHHADCGVNDLTFPQDAKPADCTCGAVIDWYEMVMQAVFDPENQPSQFGTTHCDDDAPDDTKARIMAMHDQTMAMLKG